MGLAGCPACLPPQGPLWSLSETQGPFQSPWSDRQGLFLATATCPEDLWKPQEQGLWPEVGREPGQKGRMGQQSRHSKALEIHRFVLLHQLL